MRPALQAILDALRHGPLTQARLREEAGAGHHFSDDLKRLLQLRLIAKGPATRAGARSGPTWRLVPPEARDAAERGALLLAAWFGEPAEAFFSDTRGGPSAAFARQVLMYLLVVEFDYSFDVVGMAVGRHRASVQNGFNVVSAPLSDEFDRLLEELGADLRRYVAQGRVYRAEARRGLADFLHEGAHASDGASIAP